MAPSELKKKTKKRKLEPAASSAAAAPAAVTDGAKPLLKKKKKKKVVADGEAAAVPAAAAATDPADAPKKKKKKKKKKVAAAAESAAPAPAASSSSSSTASSGLDVNAVNAYREEHSISVTLASKTNDIVGRDLDPFLTFEQTWKNGHLPKDIVDAACTSKGFEKPSPIQAQCWPCLACKERRDVIGIAKTGSGKTLAFTLPGIKDILARPKEKWPAVQMLVVAPTRELARQSQDVIEEVGGKLGIKTICLYGGVSKYDQKKILRQGVHIVVATPGRLLDLMQEGECDLSKVEYLVLDEADRMLDQGFEKEIRQIIAATKPGRQTALFSATWPEEIRKLAEEFLSRDPVMVVIGSVDIAANHKVSQLVEVVEERSREGRLMKLMQKYHSSRKNRVLVFVLYKKEAVRIQQALDRGGWNCVAIHGDATQEAREKALAQFKGGSVPVLVATDVAARGLDIPDVEVVINFSFPLTIEDYVHRIGRTGRAGKTGISHTLFHVGDKARAGELCNVLREAKQDVPNDLTKFGTFVKKKEHKLYGAFGKDVDMNAKATKIRF